MKKILKIKSKYNSCITYVKDFQFRFLFMSSEDEKIWQLINCKEDEDNKYKLLRDLPFLFLLTQVDFSKA